MTKFTGKPQFPPSPSSQWPVMGWSPSAAIPSKAVPAKKVTKEPLGFTPSKRTR